MKKPLFLALAAAAVVATPMAAQAAPYSNLNQKQAQIENRIDRGVNQGVITRNEARTLRSRLNQIERLEQQYRRSGGQFTTRERADIDRRLTSLQKQVRYEKKDRDYRNDGRNDYRGDRYRR